MPISTPSPNAVKHFLGSYRRQTVVNREGGYLRPRSGERSYDVFAVNCSMNILNGVNRWALGLRSIPFNEALLVICEGQNRVPSPPTREGRGEGFLGDRRCK